jgi:hypothetical protein
LDLGEQTRVGIATTAIVNIVLVPLESRSCLKMGSMPLLM